MYVTSRAGSVTWAASRRATATPAFMSAVPRPHRMSPSRRVGGFAAIGPVPRCPATITRSTRPRSVRATTVSPSRSTRRCEQPRKAASTASASVDSSPLTDGMSQRAAVSSGAARSRSRVTSLGRERAELVAFGIGEHMPGDLIVRVAQHPCPLGHQGGDVRGHDVPVDPVLDRLRLRDGHETQVVEGQCIAALEGRVMRLRLALGYETEHVGPPVGLGIRVGAVDDDLVQTTGKRWPPVPDEGAELSALDVGHDPPRPVVARRSNDRRTELLQPVEVSHVDVEVDPVLDRLRFGYRLDPDLPIVVVAVEMQGAVVGIARCEPQGGCPEAAETRLVVRVHAQRLPARPGHDTAR